MSLWIIQLVKKFFKSSKARPFPEIKTPQTAADVEDCLREFFFDYYGYVRQKWGGFEFTFYCCWDEEIQQWDERPDFKMKFDNYKRDTTKTAQCYYSPTDPDRSEAIKVADVVLKALEPICTTNPITTVVLECRNAIFNMSTYHNRRLKVVN